VLRANGVQSRLLNGGPRTMKKINTLTHKWTTLERWTTKVVRMTREMRRRSGAIIPVMVDSLMRVVFSGAVQKGSPEER